MLVRELADPQNSITDAEIYQFLSMGDVPYTNEELSRKFRLSSFFVSSQMENVINSGHGDYIPVHLSNIPALFKSGRIPLDVVLIQTTPPDRNGNLSLGVSIDIIKSAVENSLLVIAEVNEKMPRTMGDSFISLEQVDAIVISSEEILEYRLPEDDPVIDTIARNVVSLIENGSTLQAGIGPIAQSIYRFFGEKRDIGIHSEMIGDYVVDLVESGVINGSEKTLNRGKITTSFCMGTRKLYDFINENPVFEFRPSEYVNDPAIISGHRRMVAVNEAYEVDMTGQVCADSSGYGFSGGAGGMADFTRGASGSPDGKAIIVLRSTSKDGEFRG
jgi:acyl-CoA hydrolase